MTSDKDRTTMTVESFYDQIAPFYHLIFGEWESSIERQATALDSIIKEFWGAGIATIVDLACGIGTQTIGLAQLGYEITASDLSSSAIERARREIAARSLVVGLSVADMREASAHHQKQFDLVIACDNAVPHLLTDEELLRAFQEFYKCTRPGGGCLISVRDYEKEERAGIQVKPFGIRIEGETRYLVFQVWDFHELIYNLAMYFVEDRGGSDCVTHVMRSQYYAVGISTLMSLMTSAGFERVQRVDDRFFQPVIVGTK
jgi:SAM-dependent methyltransferase